MTDPALIVTAVATAVLAGFAGLQMILHALEGKRRRGRLESVATYHAMLVQRSLEQALRNMKDLRSKTNHEWWRQETNRMSAALGADVTANLEQLARAWIERHGASGANLQRIINQFYDGAHEINELAGKSGVGRDLASRQSGLDRARDRFQAVVNSLRDEFDLPRKALPPDSTSQNEQ
jgi:hypothetical protein